MTTRGLILLILANLVFLAASTAAAHQIVMRQSRTTRRLLRSHMRQVSQRLQRLSGELSRAQSSTAKDLKLVRSSVERDTAKLRESLTVLSKRLQARHKATAQRIAGLDAELRSLRREQGEVSAGIAEVSRELTAISGAAAGMESLRDALAHATETVDHAGLLADVALANDLLLEATEMKCRRWYLDAVRSPAGDESQT